MMAQPDAISEKYRHPYTYFKPAFGLILLREQILGKDRFDYAFKNYIHKWAYKHPQPDDFFRSMENGAGEDLSWFWKGWFYNNYKLDIALIDVKFWEKAHVMNMVLTIANKELMAMPFTVEIKYKDGSKQRLYFPVETWLQNKASTYTMPIAQNVESVAVDPDNALPDVNRKNNVKKL